MKHYATDQLDVVVNHVPHYFVAAGYPAVLVDGFVTLDGQEVFAGCCQIAVKLCGGHLDGR